MLLIGFQFGHFLSTGFEEVFIIRRIMSVVYTEDLICVCRNLCDAISNAGLKYKQKWGDLCAFKCFLIVVNFHCSYSSLMLNASRQVIRKGGEGVDM